MLPERIVLRSPGCEIILEERSSERVSGVACRQLREAREGVLAVSAGRVCLGPCRQPTYKRGSYPYPYNEGDGGVCASAPARPSVRLPARRRRRVTGS